MGTVKELFSPQGDLVWRNTNSLWGKSDGELDSPNRTPEIDCSLGFQGQYFDKETGLHYNYHRYYDADMGQYISQDPIGLLGGLHPQAYVHNPNGWVDPWGLAKCYRTMKPNTDGDFVKSPLDGAPGATQKGARTASSNPKFNDFPSVNKSTDMVGPSHTGKQGLSSSLDRLPTTRPGTVNGAIDTNSLPSGLSGINDHGKHISIYPNRDMTFGEYQSLLNNINWTQ